MNNLGEVQNIFTKEQYPPNENNVSLVPFEAIQTFLVQEFGQTGYKINVTQAGQIAGENYVIISLSFKSANGSEFSIPGAAQGSIKMPGLLATAVRNAVLRHMGAGTELYNHEEGEEPIFNDNPGVVENPFQNAQTVNHYQNPTPGQYNAAPKKDFGTWDGNLKIKSGKLAGVAWKDVDMDLIHKMAASGNNMAQKELNRRQSTYSR